MSLNPSTLPLFVFPPNWAEPPELRLRVITEIWPSKTGREERVARIAIPALSVAYSLLTDVGQAASLPQAVAAAFSRFLRDHLGQALAVPLWSEALQISSVSSATITLPSSEGQGWVSTRLFSVPRACVLVSRASFQLASGLPVAEVVFPSTVSSTTIVLNATPTHTFLPGDFIAPLIVTNPVTDNQSADWLAGFQAQSSIEFLEAFSEAHALPFDAATLLPTYRDLPLFPFLLNFAESVQDDSELRTETREDDAGQLVAAIYESASRTLPHGSVLLQNRDQIAALLTWFNAVLGRAHRTWVASARPNFTLAANVAANATTLTVFSTGYAANDFTTAQRTVILIRTYGAPLPGGAGVGPRWYARVITAAVDNNDGTETLTLDYRLPDALSAGIPSAGGAGVGPVISYLYLCRSDLDEISLKFLSQLVASADLRFHELPLETADVLALDPCLCHGLVSNAMLLPGDDCIPCPEITLDDTLPAATVGTAYTGTVTASNGASPYTYAVTSGSLPTGLSLASNGAITGTPSASGTFDFTITATDANGCTGARAYSVSSSCPSITLDDTLPDGTTGASYTGTVTASGGTAAYAYAVTSGALPTGLSLASNGAITGTPTAAGTFTPTITATDAHGCTGSRAYSISIVCPTISLNDTLPDGSDCLTYSGTVTASGGAAAYTYTKTSGSLPGGTTLNASTGVISSGGGYPSSGTFDFTITATDVHGCTGSRAYEVVIEHCVTCEDCSSCPTVLTYTLSGFTGSLAGANGTWHSYRHSAPGYWDDYDGGIGDPLVGNVIFNCSASGYYGVSLGDYNGKLYSLSGSLVCPSGSCIIYDTDGTTPLGTLTV
jgi:hypothetical protein